MTDTECPRCAAPIRPGELHQPAPFMVTGWPTATCTVIERTTANPTEGP